MCYGKCVECVYGKCGKYENEMDVSVIFNVREKYENGMDVGVICSMYENINDI